MPLSNTQMRDVQSVLHPYTNLMKFRETGIRKDYYIDDNAVLMEREINPKG